AGGRPGGAELPLQRRGKGRPATPGGGGGGKGEPGRSEEKGRGLSNRSRRARVLHRAGDSAPRQRYGSAARQLGRDPLQPCPSAKAGKQARFTTTTAAAAESAAPARATPASGSP